MCSPQALLAVPHLQDRRLRCWPSLGKAARRATGHRANVSKSQLTARDLRDLAQTSTSGCTLPLRPTSRRWLWAQQLMNSAATAGQPGRPHGTPGANSPSQRHLQDQAGPRHDASAGAECIHRARISSTGARRVRHPGPSPLWGEGQARHATRWPACKFGRRERLDAIRLPKHPRKQKCSNGKAGAPLPFPAKPEAPTPSRKFKN